jgi:hypothetical protein
MRKRLPAAKGDEGDEFVDEVGGEEGFRLRRSVYDCLRGCWYKWRCANIQDSLVPARKLNQLLSARGRLPLALKH